MTPLIRKEIRLLLPFFGIALLLAVLPAWIVSENSFAWSGNESIYWIFGFGLVLLGLAPFGQEFGLGTFSTSLAQPAQRSRIWWTKLLLILVAALLVLLALIVSIHLRFDALLKMVAQNIEEDTRANRLWDLAFQKSLLKNLNSHAFWWVGIAAAAVGVTGGLWASLLFRQVGAALWFSLLVPAVSFFGVEWFVPGDSAREIVLLAGAAAYSIAGVFWAHRMFLRAQDAQWLGDSISLTGLRTTGAAAEGVRARSQSSLTTLLRKEIQFQQITLLIAFGILVLHICTLATRKFCTLPGNSELRFALESVPFLWLLLPWLAGSVAVAEERKLGTHESQLCLPAKRWRQFAVKFCVAFLLGLLLGAIFPWLIERIAILCHIPSGVFKVGVLAVNSDAKLSLNTFCTLAITFVVASFFASTFTRNTLHALGLAIVFGAASIGLYQWVMSESYYANDYYYYSLWKGPLIFVIGMPMAVIAVVWMSFSNYKLLHVGGKVWFRNFLVLSISLILAGTATALIYQRPWEMAMTLEPKHGQARLSGPIRPTICMANERVFALLPDGRLWAAGDYHWKGLDRYEEVSLGPGKSNHLRQVRVPVPAGGVFVGGSNWVALAAGSTQVVLGSTEVVGLQSDGSLWRILALSDKTNYSSWNFWHSLAPLSLAPKPRRIGSDNDWKSVVADWFGFMALKTDGTLWAWGRNYEGLLVPDTNKYYISEPLRIGTNSDWAAIFPEGGETWLVKNDGSVWAELMDSREGKARYVLQKTHWNGSDWLAVTGGPSRNFLLHKDGTLWASGWLPRVVFGAHIYERERHELIRIGQDSDWTQIAENYWDIVGLKRDGRLVESERELFSRILGQPSKYSDWIAVDADWGGMAALASDGTVSYWSVYDRTGGGLLGPTHRPLWSLNVLSGLQSEQHPQ